MLPSLGCHMAIEKSVNPTWGRQRALIRKMVGDEEGKIKAMDQFAARSRSSESYRSVVV